MWRISQRRYGEAKSRPTISDLNKKAYLHIEEWQNRPLQGGKYAYVDVDGVQLVVGDKCLGMMEAVGEVFPRS